MNTDTLSEINTDQRDEVAAGDTTATTDVSAPEDSTGLPECILANLAGICVVMRAQQVARFEVTYNGSGDSGDAEYPLAYDADNKEMPFDGAAEVSYRRRYSPDEATSETLEDAVQELLDEVLSATGNSGYENSEGGGGTLTINATGTIQLDHYDYVVETVDSSYNFAVPAVSEAAV